MRISRRIVIPEEEIHLSFVRSSGPGGQNVNKVSTAVQLRFDAAHSPSISEDVRERLLKLAGQRATANGMIIIEARQSRSQARNRDQVLSRFRNLVRQAERKPRRRLATTPSSASIERRLQRKKRRSQKKQRRGWTPTDE